jgi:hypothetical protein
VLATATALAVTLAATSNPWLEKARAAYSKLDCDAVLSDLAQARQVPTDDAATKLSIFDLEGRCHVALGHAADAEAAFTQMLGIDAQAELDPALSPKIRDAFKRAKLKLFPEDYVAFKELAPAPELIRVELVDPWHRVRSVVLGRWREAEQRFVEQTLTPRDNVYLAQVKGHDFYLEARTANGDSVARIGSKDVPAAAPIAAAPVPTVESKPLEEAPLAEPPRDPKKGKHIAGGVLLATGGALIAAGIVMFALGGANRAQAEKAEWANDAARYDNESNTEGALGHALFWPGLAVGTVGLVLSF